MGRRWGFDGVDGKGCVLLWIDVSRWLREVAPWFVTAPFHSV